MKSDSILISIIMSCYNEKMEWVRESIESILNQTYENIEFIIVCDNPDNFELKQVLLEYKDKDSRIKLILNEKNIGLVKSLNRALSSSTGELIGRMDADDVSNTRRLEKQLKYLQDNNYDFLMSGIDYIDEENNILVKKTKTYLLNFNSNKIKKALKYGNMSIHPTWIFKRDILKKVNNYNNVDYVEDYDFICRTILLGFKVGFIPERLLNYRVRLNGITRSRRAYQEINAQIISKEYQRALNGHEYNAMNKINNIKKAEIENFIICHEEFQKGKALIRERKMISGINKLIKIILQNDIKRNQILNYIKRKIITYINF